MTGSWTKLYASINLKPWRTDFPVLSVYLYLIGEAVYKPTKKGDEIINPGQCTVTYSQVCRFAGVTEKQLKRAIEVLRDDEIIEWEGRKKYCLVTIVNWEKTYGSQSQKDVKTEVKTDEKREVKRDVKRDDSYRRTDLLTSRRIDSVNTPPTPQGGEPSQNSDLKNEGEGSNTPVEQQPPEGQKKKSSGQKRKGDAMPIEVFAAKAFPELMRDDEAAEALIQVLKKRKPSSRTDLSARLLRKKWGAYPVEYQKAAVIQSATSGYQGIFPVKDENKSGQKPGQSGQKPAYQTAQVNFKKEADLIDMIKFSDDNAAQRTYNLEMRAKLYLVRKGKDSQDPNLLKSVKEAHDTGKLNLDALDLNPTNSNE